MTCCYFVKMILIFLNKPYLAILWCGHLELAYLPPLNFQNRFILHLLNLSLAYHFGSASVILVMRKSSSELKSEKRWSILRSAAFLHCITIVELEKNNCIITISNKSSKDNCPHEDYPILLIWRHKISLLKYKEFNKWWNKKNKSAPKLF